jgi:hypothetical protein
MGKLHYDIEDLKTQIINASLIVIGIFAAILLVLIVAGTFQKGFHIETGIRIAILFTLVLLAFFRKKIPLGLKTAYLRLFPL